MPSKMLGEHWTYMLLVLAANFCQGSSRQMIVSAGGDDHPSCGRGGTVGTWADTVTPCRTISYAASLTEAGDTILLDTSQGKGAHMFVECRRNATILTHNITIKAYPLPAFIGCMQHRDHNRIFLIGSRDLSAPPVVSLLNVVVRNGRISIFNGALMLRDSVLENVPIRSVDGCESAGLDASNTTVRRMEHWDGGLEAIDSSIKCDRVRGRIENSQFADVNLHFEGYINNLVDIDRSNFTQELQMESGIGGLNVSLPYAGGHLRVSRSIFEKHRHFDPLHSIINIEAGTLRIEGNNRNLLNQSQATVEISDSIFRDNERGLSISMLYKNISITGCLFERNVAMHAGAAVRITTNTTVVFTDTIFRDNMAGHNWYEIIPGKFEFDGEQVRISGDTVNGIINLVGKGGAVRIHRGFVAFDNCTFVNNSAKLLGGAIFVDRDATVLIDGCYFENSNVRALSMQGDLMYSSGWVTIQDSVFKVLMADNHVSVLRHGGTHWSLEVKRMWFECPVGYKLVMVNNTSHRIEKDAGLVRSHKLDQMYYYCETCGDNQYSVDRGFVNYTLATNNTEYFTLLINGKQPFQSHPVAYEYGNITCKDCPYGADCENGITAIANFWGYLWVDRLCFQHCPPTYCCHTTTCPDVDSCAKNRHGRLCGQCKPGYSEAMFSSNCVANDNCRSYWIWPISFMMGFIYMLFLIFHRDIRGFLSSWQLEREKLLHCCSCCRRSMPHFVAYVRRKSLDKQENGHCSERRKYSATFSSNFDAEGSASDGHVVTTSLITEPASAHRRSTPPTSRKEGIEYVPSEHPRENAATKQPQANKGSGGQDAGILIILFYYFQDALILHIETVYTKVESKLIRQLKTFLVGIFRFRLELFQFLDDVCLFANQQPVQKLFSLTLFVPYVLVLIGLMYCAYNIVKRLKAVHKQSRRVPEDLSPEQAEEGESAGFSCRLASGFILALMFTYQKLATATFTLLNCVPVRDANVLFIDGTQKCFQGWQYGVMAYAGVCVLPFSLVLMFGPPLLRRDTINLCEFFVGCICPLPSLLWWLSKHLRRAGRTFVKSTSPEKATVLHILQGPFKGPTNKTLSGELCWAGVLIGRRVVLFLCFTFINDVLVRLLCMFFASFVILMHHMYVRPYKSPAGNLAGALSAAALLVVGTINLLRAAFEAAEYVPQGPYRSLMAICEEIENILLLWLPLVGVSLILVFVVVKLAALLMSKVWHCSCGHNLNRKTDESVPMEVETKVSA